MTKTTICVSWAVKTKIKEVKVHPRETDNQCLERVLGVDTNETE